MFDNSRYVTRRINEEVDINLQLALWSLIDDLKKKKNFNVDYLQVFELKTINNAEKFNQEVIHRQEVPMYKKSYLFSIENAIDEKIFIIDDGDHSTMMFASDY